jgi:TolB protein
MRKQISWIVVGVLGLLATGPAQVEVEGAGRINVAVSSLGGSEGAAATKVLSADLERTMMIKVTASERYVVSGQVAGGSLSGKLTDRSQNKELLSKSYSGDWRHATHEFADDITEAVTGVKGFATSRVAFISAATGNKELYVMDIDGANVSKFSNDKSISNGPAFSKDGRMIAYTSYKSGYPDVYVVKLAEKVRDKIAFFPGINSGASFSPDNQTIALTLSKDGNPEIYTMPVSGGSPKRLTRTRGTETSPSWSPDGSQIVYTSDDRGSVQLYIMSSEGGEPERLATLAGYSSEPDWSPDGKAISFTARTGGGFQIYNYDLTSRKSEQVSPGSGEDPSFTRNSRHLVYSNGGHLYLLDTVKKQSVLLDNNLTKCSEPAVSR